MELIVLILLIIILVFYTQKETFINNIGKGLSCIDYIKNVKKWNIDSLNDSQKYALSALKTGQTTQYTDDSIQYPYTNSCVIPVNTYGLFDINNIDSNGTTITIDDSLIDPSPCGSKDNNYKPLAKKYNLNTTETGEYPVGVRIDLDDDKTTYRQFIDILQGLSQKFNRNMNNNRKGLYNEINQLNRDIDRNNNILKSLVDQKDTHIRNKNNLREQCERDRIMMNNSLNVFRSVSAHDKFTKDRISELNRVMSNISADINAPC